MMKRAITFFMVLGISLLADAQLPADKITMGYFTLPPHQFRSDGTAAGAAGGYITFFEIVVSKMGHQVEWIGPLPLPRLTEYLKAGAIVDGTVGFPKFTIFEKFLYYPDAPLFMGQPILGVIKDHPLSEIKTIDDIRGFRIGLVKSFSGRYDPLIDAHRNVIYLEELGGENWMQQNLEKLIAGRLDAMFDRQEYTMPCVAAALNMAHKIKILPMPSPPTPVFVTFAKASKHGKRLLDEYNAAISEMTLDYEQLLYEQMRAASGSTD